MKTKVAKVKRNNQKRNKLKKQGVIKSTKGRKLQPSKQNVPKIVAPTPAVESEESDDGEDMLQMVEADDLTFLKSALHNRSYSLLNKIRYTNKQRTKKVKVDETDYALLEQNYESNQVETIKMKNLLPIKTKAGIVPQAMEDNSEETFPESKEEQISGDEEEGTDSLDFVFQDDNIDATQPVSNAQLLATREEALKQQKVHIGTLCVGLLENPEEKITNFRTLLKILDETLPEGYFTIKKLTIVSLLEVFKDLLPSYQIKPHEKSDVKLKKDTLKLLRFETVLLQYYKNYLQKLEKLGDVLLKRKNGHVSSVEETQLAELSVKSMSELLTTHTYFNYSQNIAQSIVPYLNNHNESVRQCVANACKTVFHEDKKGEITLKIVRFINQFVKNHPNNVKLDMLEVLLSLKIKDINLDQEKENEIKQRKLMTHKQRLLNLSKKERKRKKHLDELEKEMLETKAEENKQTKHKNLTEITKLVFGIYFRILKNSTNTKMLGICLEGIAKYAHCINLEFYVDLVNILDKLLKEDWLSYREQLHCVQTVFSILSGQGEALNLDPTRFYNCLYKDLLTTHASKNYVNVDVVLKTLTVALVKRHRNISNKRIIGFVKRIATLSMQLLHNGTLSCLAIIKLMIQMHKTVDILLDLDSSVGEGKYDPQIEDAEYSNANSSALYEMVPLMNHYHPIVSKFATHIAKGVAATGDGSLPSELGKCSPEQLFIDYDMSELAFAPPVPVPKKVQPKLRMKKFYFLNDEFKKYCSSTMKNSKNVSNGFYINL